MAGKIRIFTLLDTAAVALGATDVPEFDEDDVRVIFCVTCMKREPQLMASMAMNVCLWWSLRKYWRLVIVRFCNDSTLCKRICRSC